MPSDDVRNQLIVLLPKMRIWAIAMTRRAAAAEGLIQDTATKVLAAQDSFIPGTNFSAWVHRIMRNHFITGIRKHRPTVGLHENTGAAIGAGHEDGVALKELAVAMDHLAPDHREALFMVVFQELSYAEVAAITGCAEGTIKSRVHRARQMLQAWLLGERMKPTSEGRKTAGSTPRNDVAVYMNYECA